MDLKEAVIIITGGGTGVGSACAHALAKCGARIVISYNKSEEGALHTKKNVTLREVMRSRFKVMFPLMTIVKT